MRNRQHRDPGYVRPSTAPIADERSTSRRRSSRPTAARPRPRPCSTRRPPRRWGAARAARPSRTDQRGQPRPAGQSRTSGHSSSSNRTQTVPAARRMAEAADGRAATARRCSGLPAGGPCCAAAHGEDLLDGERRHALGSSGGPGWRCPTRRRQRRPVRLQPASRQPAGAPRTDSILSRSVQGDRIDLHKLDGDPDAAGNQRLEFIGGQRKFSDAGQVRAGSRSTATP